MYLLFRKRRFPMSLKGREYTRPCSFVLSIISHVCISMFLFSLSIYLPIYPSICQFDRMLKYPRPQEKVLCCCSFWGGNSLKNQKSKKERKHALNQESKMQGKTIKIKKKEGEKWKTQIRIKHLASFLDIFNLVKSANDRNYNELLKVKLIGIFQSKNFLIFLTVFLVAFLADGVFSFFLL